MKKVGEIIKDRRKTLSITQKELADLAGVGINTLTKIERGEANPTMDILSRIIETLGLEMVITTRKRS